MTDQEFLTKEKFDELQVELIFLRRPAEKRLRKILNMRVHGDISENAEYHEARDLQAATEDRINKLNSILKSAKIVAKKVATQFLLALSLKYKRRRKRKEFIKSSVPKRRICRREKYHTSLHLARR